MKRLISFGIAVGALFLLSACNRGITVKIGVAAPMTGALANFGQDMARGAQIAADELNREKFLVGGKVARFEILTEDDKADVDTGKGAAKRLIDAGVAAVFGHLNSGVSIAAAPMYAAAGIPQLSASTNPKFTRMGLKTTFRIGADDVNQGETLARLAGEKFRSKSIFILDDQTEFGMGLGAEVRNSLTARNKAFHYEHFDPASADYALLALKIKNANADAVVFAGDGQGGVPLLRALRKAESAAKFLAGDAMCDSAVVQKSQGDANANFYCSVPGVPPSWLASGIEFSQMYQARYGKPGPFAIAAYDGIHVLAQAMQVAQSEQPAVYLPHMTQTSFDGKIQGIVEFDKSGNLKDGSVLVYRTIGGELTEQQDLR